MHIWRRALFDGRNESYSNGWNVCSNCDLIVYIDGSDGPNNLTFYTGSALGKYTRCDFISCDDYLIQGVLFA